MAVIETVAGRDVVAAVVIAIAAGVAAEIVAMTEIDIGAMIVAGTDPTAVTATTAVAENEGAGPELGPPEIGLALRLTKVSLIKKIDSLSS